jgi:hypothetical protein
VPYVERQYRKEIDECIANLISVLNKDINQPDGFFIRTARTTYAIYKLVKDLYGKLNWTWRAQVYMILMSVLTEFQRKCMEPYEDVKIEQNGDVE